MKKVIMLSTFCVGFLATVQSQITISATAFPAKGDSLLTATDILVGDLKIAKNGVNQVWDFTALNGKIISKTTINAANTGAAFAKFPTADLVENRNGIYYYINVTNKNYEEVGISGASADFFGINTTTQIAPSNVLRRAPMAFFDLNFTSSATAVTYPISSLPDSIFGSINQFLSLADSLRVINKNTRTDLVDGYGTMKLPIGNYEVLREKRTNYADADLEVRLTLTKTWFGLKQLIPQNQIPNSLKRFLGKDTTTTYHFYAANVKEPVAIATVDNTDNTKVRQVTYKTDLKKSTASADLEDNSATIEIYPNPTTGVVTLSSSEKIEHIAIFDALGKNIFSQNFDNQIITTDMSHFENGFYFIKINKKTAIKVIKN